MIIDYYKQYGITNIIKRVFSKPFNSIFRITNSIILIIPNHKKSTFNSSSKIITHEKIEEWLKNDYIDLSESNRFIKFLNTDCIGYYIEIEKELAAWGFVQTKGDYQYDKYIYSLPEKVYMLKNLFVKSKFRGMALGKMINEVRVNNIPDSYIPCGFVIPENKYAIRNLKMLGFEEFIKIRHILWFKSFTKTTIKIMKDSEITDILIKGFNDKNKAHE